MLELNDILREVLRAGIEIASQRICRSHVGSGRTAEAEIDAANADLAALRSFVLPGGTPLAAHLHLARTVCRRAERYAVALAEAEAINPEAVRYLNRLSDWLFVMGRVANDGGRADVLWVPGANR